jgi:hypothetical protein
MKVPIEWDEDYLLQLIAIGEKESIELDYKACGSLSKMENKMLELSKDVSAFANSAGGVIIYGIVEDGHVPIKIDTGYDRSIISKEWLEQVINSRIHRRIDGIRIKQVELKKSAPGKVAYVVVIPQSNRAPHQAHDKRFYKRFNFQSVAMEEYEIRDVSRRNEAPDLKISFTVTADWSSQKKSIQGQISPLQVQLLPVVSNESPTPAMYSHVQFYIDSRLQLHYASSMIKMNDELIEVNDQSYTCTVLHMNFSIPLNMPIFQGLTFALLVNPLIFEIKNQDMYILGWKILSPGMEQKNDISFLNWNGVEIDLKKMNIEAN